MTLDNIRFKHLFSGTDDEEEFYRASAGVELRRVELLNIIKHFQSLPNVTDDASIWKISQDFQCVTSLVEELNDIVQSIRAHCDPHVFHWSIRPWFCGADANGPNSCGWIFEGVNDSDKLDLSSPSGGQSTVMHALDVWLDIDHKLAKKRLPAPTEDNKKPDHRFMDKMRRYMPGMHWEYLEYIQNSLRPLCELVCQTPALRELYNAVVMALKKLRDNHKCITCLYVITMSKLEQYTCPVMASMAKEQWGSVRSGPAQGTGGNELATLLKAGRDTTWQAVL